jgi:hypothetical protein
MLTGHCRIKSGKETNPVPIDVQVAAIEMDAAMLDKHVATFLDTFARDAKFVGYALQRWSVAALAACVELEQSKLAFAHFEGGPTQPA